MYKYPFTLKQHTPLVHYLGIESGAKLQTKAVIPLLNKFITEKVTAQKGVHAKTEFIKRFKGSCISFEEKNWNAGRCIRCKKKEDCEYDRWFRNKKDVESLSFNYDLNLDCKVDIEASYTQKIINQEKAHILFSDRRISGSIVCLTPSLLEKIKNILPEFFVLTGFGYRSSKGYGCFTLKETTEDDYQRILKETYQAEDQGVFWYDTTSDDKLKEGISRLVVEECKKIEIKNSKSGSADDRKLIRESVNSRYRGFRLEEPWGIDVRQNKVVFPSNLTNSENEKIELPKDIFKGEFTSNVADKAIQLIIELHWKYIKSGTNYPYNKSLLWMYFCGQHGNESGWEKRFIKESLRKNHQDLFNSLKKKDENRPMRFDTRIEPTKYHFFRALLGLAEHYEFALLTRIDNKFSFNINVKSGVPNIERIPSPVRFKVFEDTIYLIVDAVDPAIQDATFTFMYKNNQLKLGEIDHLSIQIPPNGLKDFFTAILMNTAELLGKQDPAISNHPICNQYILLKHE